MDLMEDTKDAGKISTFQKGSGNSAWLSGISNEDGVHLGKLLNQ